MKLAVTGKGGVGKTTVSALLSAALHRQGRRVVAIDADPDSNLAATMGYRHAADIRPIVEMKELIAERTGVQPGSTGGMFLLNPTVDDIPARYAVDVNGVKVLVAGAVKKGGAGCYCPENALLRALIGHLLIDREAALVLDMEAGIEHLTRGTVRDVDRLLIVVEPGMRSVETALRIRELAADIGLARLSVVGNKVRAPKDEAYLRAALPGMEFAGFLPFDEQVREAEAGGRPVAGASKKMDMAVESVVNYLANALKEQARSGNTTSK